MSLDTLAAKSGVTRGALWKLETSSDPNPTLKTLMKIVDGLELPPLCLFARRLDPRRPARSES